MCLCVSMCVCVCERERGEGVIVVYLFLLLLLLKFVAQIVSPVSSPAALCRTRPSHTQTHTQTHTHTHTDTHTHMGKKRCEVGDCFHTRSQREGGGGFFRNMNEPATSLGAEEQRGRL